jgi:hypothetical protein
MIVIFLIFLNISSKNFKFFLTIQVPDEFLFDPITRTYGDPSKRPEINSSTIEFIAPAEYTVS